MCAAISARRNPPCNTHKHRAVAQAASRVFNRQVDQFSRIVTGVVNTIARVEIKNGSPISGLELGAAAAHVIDVHSQDFEHSHPLRVDIMLVKTRGTGMRLHRH